MTLPWDERVSADVITLCVNVLLQSTVLVALALLVARLLPHKPTIRHCVLFSALLGLLAIPVLNVALSTAGVEVASMSLLTTSEQKIQPTAALPAVDLSAIPVSEPGFDSLGTKSAGDISDAEASPNELSALDQSSAETTAHGATNTPFNYSVLITRALWSFCSIWLLGSVVVLAGLIHSDWKLRRIIHKTRPFQLHGRRGVTEYVCQILKIESVAPIVCSADITGPTTAGIVRPLILLPFRIVGNLRSEELRDILLHEMAHVLRRDQLIVVLQHLAGALYWLNPLVYLLNRQLARAREEICDNYVLSTVKPVDYGETLKRLGQLLPRPRMIASSVCMFNNDWKLEDRIAGLLDERRIAVKRLHPLCTVAIVLTAAVFSLAMAGSRVGLAQAESTSDATTTKSANASTKDLAASAGLEYVPSDALLVVSIQPAALLSHPGLKEMGEIIAKDERLLQQFGMPLTDISRLTVIPFASAQPDSPDTVGFVVHSLKPFNKDNLLEVVAPQAQKKQFEGDVYYYDKPSPGLQRYVSFPDNQTIIYANQQVVFERLAKAGRAGATSAAWAESWPVVQDRQLAIAGNPAQIKSFMDKAMARAPEGALQSFAPLWNDNAGAVMALELDQQLRLHAQFSCKSPEDAPEIEKSLRASIAFAKAQLENQQQQLAGSPWASKTLSLYTDLALQLLKKISIERKGQLVQLLAGLDPQATAQLLAQSVATLRTDRGSAHRKQSFNNLKQFALGMHNYHDVNGHFPPPTLAGPDGKTLHSWRVALLPYLDQQELYNEYRKDEPWDSPHNKELISKMPAIFGHPSAKAESGVTSYFVLTGKDTAFVGKKGTSIREILDGTSNTMLIVETKQDIPWTKPVDIPYDSKKPLPKLGGFQPEGFCMGACDGSARFISHDIPEKTLRAWITIDGGEVIMNNP